LNIVAAAAMVLISTGASALGLGRVNVQSVLGETLRAEIEVTSLNAEEASSLQVRLASPEAFKAAGVDYNPVLLGAKIALSSRGADRTPVLLLTSDRVVQEPFVDVIVDFAWSTGRLTRSYTLLIDPPGRNVAAQPATAPVAPVFSAPAPAARAVAPASQSQVAQAPAPVAAPAVTTPAPRPAPSAAQAPAPAPVARSSRTTPAPAATPAPAPTESASGDTVHVRPGDTLTSIAAAKKEPGVSLDQMLVSLFRSNPQAFIDENMNRMKSGVTLAVPSADAAKQLSSQEARQIIQAQSADFAAYRQRLAGGVATVKTGEGARQATGKVEAQIRDEKTASAPPAPEKLTLSHGTAKPGTVTQEAKVSKDTQRQAEAARVAELSRNVAELKKLSAGTAAAPAATTAPAAPAAPAVPALTVARATPAATASAPAAAKPAPAAVPSAAAPAVVPPPVVTLPASAPAASTTAVAPSAPVVASAAQAVASAPALHPRPKPHPALQPKPAEEESFLSSLTDEPYVIPGLGVLVAAIAGLAFWRKRKGGRKSFSGETSFIESKIQQDSFFGVSGGQRVDTRDGASTTSSASSSLNYSLSQLDAIGDVDPVAEADVYLAYGRDLQAEEILKEAQRSDPDRLAIRTKLLEVYAKRADLKTFETQARQLRDITNGYGEDWAKAQELGRQIDPTNPLYREGDGDYGTEDTEPTPLEPLPADADAILNRAAAATAPMPMAQPHSEFESTDLPLPIDLDVDLEAPAAAAPAVAERAPAPAPAPAAAPVAEMEDLPFQVSDFSIETAPEVPEVTAPVPATASAATPRPADGPASMLPPSIDFDFGDLSLDLEPPADHAAERAAERAIAAASEASVPELDLGGDDASEPMARKIELADEFRRIGDHEGARELLEEVVSKADGSLRSRAQTMLDALG